MGPQIIVDFTVLEKHERALADSAAVLEELLAEQLGAVARLEDLWTGAAAAGFQQSYDEWSRTADGLVASLHRLRQVVGTAIDNYAGARTTGLRIWGAE